MVKRQWYWNVFENVLGKSVVAERIIKTLKTEIYKYMTQKMCISIN